MADMLSNTSLTPAAPVSHVAGGEQLIRRGETPTWACYLESGQVALGLMENHGMEHQFGQLTGPCWLEPGAALLGLPHCVDVVAEMPLSLRRVPLDDFGHMLEGVPPAALSLLHDLARAQRQQTEWAVSRMARDAESRCAEWLLRHAQPGESGTMAVQLQQRKRSIAAQLGIAPETLSRLLRHLRERSLISGSGRILNLVDLSGLKSLAGV